MLTVLRNDQSENLSSVMLGPVPSICSRLISDTWLDPRHKAEDDVTCEAAITKQEPPLSSPHGPSTPRHRPSHRNAASAARLPCAE
ncbi:hypothetical protein FLX27_13960 [Agrobacterium tumefaciens]|nr:hypothetical protein FLX27_13960 [Agrobacterium tumefaciens]